MMWQYFFIIAFDFFKECHQIFAENVTFFAWLKERKIQTQNPNKKVFPFAELFPISIEYYFLFSSMPNTSGIDTCCCVPTSITAPPESAKKTISKYNRTIGVQTHAFGLVFQDLDVISWINYHS